jgi:hypothetical protein
MWLLYGCYAQWTFKGFWRRCLLSVSSCPNSHMQEMRKIIKQGYANLGCQAPWSAKFCVVVPYICGSAVWNFLRVTHLTPIILWWLLDFWKICASLAKRNSILCALAQMSLKDSLEFFSFGLTMLLFVGILFYGLRTCGMHAHVQKCAHARTHTHTHTYIHVVNLSGMHLKYL